MNSLVIVDTQSRVAAELDENSARDMNLFIEQCYRIAIGSAMLHLLNPPYREK